MNSRHQAMQKAWDSRPRVWRGSRRGIRRASILSRRQTALYLAPSSRSQRAATSVAAMILVDDGKLDLDAPVTRYLPELQDMRVAVEKTNPATGTTEHGLDLAKRPMTVRDLLRHTSGIVYPELDFAFPERGLADAASEAGIRYVHMLYSWADATAYRRDTTLADFVSVLARLPLAHQPGEVWEYGLSADVLGRVVEAASGEPLDQFLQSRIFSPLHMVDTGFSVPAAKLGRLVHCPIP